MAKSVRYMDVMAIRSSSKANKTHQLLVEPLVLPEMDHVDVEQTAEISDKCLFYPSGKKNKNLRQELITAVRNIYKPNEDSGVMHMAPTTSIEDSNSFYTSVQKGSIISKDKKIKVGKNKKTKESKVLKYRQPLAHNRTNDQLQSSVKSLLDVMHQKEKMITSITTVRV